MIADQIAKAAVTIDAPAARVWQALVDPDAIRQYMFGTEVVSTWKKGSPITWEGEWEGKHYKDKGVIVDVQRETLLKYTHWSPNGGLPDRPENYHTVVYELAEQGEGTLVSLSQDGNESEEAAEHSQSTWETVLAGLKETVERH